MSPVYDEIGRNYAGHRRPDPRIERAILEALGDAESVVNVGAGAGSYEPRDREVIPIEPSGVMAAQRPPDRAAATIAQAESLPLEDDAVDAALGILTVHHWSDPESGVLEMKRVARNRIVLLTVDPLVSGRMWLLDRYFPQIARRDIAEFPAIKTLEEWLGKGTGVDALPVPSDCSDGFLLSFWSRPETVLDRGRRASTSGFARLDARAEPAGLERLRNDLASGLWDEMFGSLRDLAELDCGLRMVTCRFDAL